MGVIPLLHLTRRGSRNRAGSITPNISGAVESVTLDGVAAWLPLAACTNLVTNPIFGVNTTGWTATVGAISRDVSWAFTGPASGKVTATGANSKATVSLNLPASSHIISGYIRNTSLVSLTFRATYNGSAVGGFTTIPAGGEDYIEAIVTGTATAVATGIICTNSVNGNTFQIGYLQVEARLSTWGRQRLVTLLDSFGALPPGVVWNGTPHASTSTRSYGRLATNVTDYPYLAGSLYIRTTSALPAIETFDSRLLQVGSYSANNWEMIYRNPGSYNGEFRVNNAPAGTYTRPVLGSQPIVNVAMGWDNPVSFFRVNGSKITGNNRTVSPSGLSSEEVVLGSDGWGSVWSAPISDLLIYPRMLTDAEMDQLDASPGDALNFFTLADTAFSISTLAADSLSILSAEATPPFNVTSGGT